MNEKEKKFNKIVNDIKQVKIQGARNIARAALLAYKLSPKKSSIQKLISARATEPMLKNVLKLAEKKPLKEILKHFDFAQKEINKSVFKIIKNGDIILTHCHSTNVVQSLIYSKKQGKKFEVYNTETRPLYQGRKTAIELRRVGIKVTMFVDSAIDIALSGSQKNKKANKVFLGADALIEKGIINKVGSSMIAKLARLNKVPLYIIADSWKFTKEKVPIEYRALNEVWDKAPKEIKIKNPAFEFVNKKYIKAIISEKGILNYNNFVKKMKKVPY
ncbi:MAG: translation initiation factor IF-2B subunit delta [Candidatus Pacearchaeota archaeon]|nr:MAG: translation initiation factor IF-2B subunit delta [Candidatus Pacearchaeota archaeon]